MYMKQSSQDSLSLDCIASRHKYTHTKKTLI